MRALYLKNILFTAAFFVCFCAATNAQNGYVAIEQDPRIEKLMKLKSELSPKIENDSYYKIQVFYGGFNEAKEIEQKVKSDFPYWPVRIDFDTPHYKVRLGKFKTRLEADKHLIEVRKKYPQAFLLSPKKTT